MSASRGDKLWFWLICFCVFGLLVFLLRSILLPFVAGMAIAYFLDPLVNRLQRLGLSRTVVTVIITLAFFVMVVVLGLVLVPMIEDQVVNFAQRVPDYVHKLMLRAQPIWASAKRYLSADDLDQLRSAGSEYAGTVATWLGAFFTRLLTGSLVVFNVLSLIFVTPIVTFYMLRDWNALTRRVDAWLPLAHAQTIREQLHEMDVILAGFVRGQALVCLSLGSFYALGLTIVGLDLGLVVGFAAGLASFIPYLGTISGFIAGISLALAQSQDWNLPLMVAGVFIVGNILENYVLSPKLVGEKIGLHPVWVIFALLAGGALFGFLGILLALPVTATIGVLARFGLKRYMASSFYRGEIIPGKQTPGGTIIVESKEK